jgi:stage II sporulation protein AA (anti-sigma F factor antagonist)
VADTPEEPFAIEVSRVGDDVDVVAITGELDFSEAPAFARTLEQLRDGGSRWFVLDLAELTFIDSSGINALVIASKATAASGGAFVVSSARQHVQRVFEIVKLSEFVPLESGLDAALQRVAWRRGLKAG